MERKQGGLMLPLALENHEGDIILAPFLSQTNAATPAT